MISYAGIPLLLEDSDGRLQRWLDEYCSIDDMRPWSESASRVSSRPNSISGLKLGRNLPIPNYAEPLRPKLSTLYWPTGAARWSHGFFLASTTQLAAILNYVGNSNTAAPLVMDDGTTSLTTQMYLLPPRLVTAAPLMAQSDQALYILPLVDARYYWQFVNSDNFYASFDTTDTPSITDWDQAYDALETALGITISHSAVASDYHTLDPDEFLRRYENAAVLLDAVAHSVGHRIVRQIDGAVISMDWSASVSNFAASGILLAGGNFGTYQHDAVKAAQVKVVFRKWRCNQIDIDGEVHVVTKNATDYGTAGTSGAVKTIHTTAYADFTLEASDPDNNTDVVALANQIAADYYAGHGKRYDYVFAGISAWYFTGFDNYAEFCLGRLHCIDEVLRATEISDSKGGEDTRYALEPKGRYQAYTRVCSQPDNFGVEEQLSQFYNLPADDCCCWLPFRNDSGEEVPANGVMAVTGIAVVNGTKYLTIEKPGSTFYRQYAVNGPKKIADEGYGHCALTDCLQWALYYESDGTPAIGEGWGPKPSSWFLHKHWPGYRIVGGETGTNPKARVRVVWTGFDKLNAKSDSDVDEFDEDTSTAGSGTASVYYKNASNVLTDTAWNVTFWSTMGSVASGDWMLLDTVANEYVIDAKKC